MSNNNRQNYNPYDWFWNVADQNIEGQPQVFYSSRVVDYVGTDHPLYERFIAQGNRVTQIPTEADLIEVLLRQNQDALPYSVAGNAKRVALKVDKLWNAANNYVTGRISGVAIGILTLGVMQQLPKSLAIAGWSNQVWTEYYTRKAGITPTSELNLDFSSFGNLPYSIPEMQAEVGM